MIVLEAPGCCPPAYTALVKELFDPPLAVPKSKSPKSLALPAVGI